MASNLSDGEQVLDFLAHHGVKGQRWGVITKRASIGRRAVASKIGTLSGNIKDQRAKFKANKETKLAAKTKGGSRSYKKFSDAELNRRIKRLEQEKTYRDLKADRHLVRGRKVTREILEASLTKAGTYAATKTLKLAFDTTLDKKATKATKEKVEEAVKKAKEAHDSLKVVADEVKQQAKTAPKLDKKEIGRAKSYKQTKPSPKLKRYPRNPGSTAK